MNKILIFCLIVISFFSKIDASDPDVIFLTSQRSGSHWLMYSITQCTGRQWYEASKPLNHPSFKGDPTLKPLLFGHFIDTIPHDLIENPQETKLLMIIRDYRESLIRHYKTPTKAIQNLNNYPLFQNLQIFENWDPKLRMIVYYEDLINAPEYTLSLVMDFLERGRENIPQFMDNFAQHRKRSLETYDRRSGRCRSRGKNLHYHSEKANPEDLEALVKIVKARKPKLYNKYLNRYK